MTENSPKVSVVIPVYNGEAFIETAIQSVLEQSYRPIEIIAVNDGSPDRSAEVLQQFENKITVVNQHNTGVAGARNTGIDHATGELIAFLDQDDWWHPQKVSRQMEVFRSHSEIGLVHTGVAHIDSETGNEVGPLNPNSRPELMTGDCWAKLLLGNPVYNSSVVVRRSVLEHVGKCDATMAGNTVADYELWLRIAKHYQFGFVDQPLTYYRMHEQQGMLDRRAMLTSELKVLLQIQDERTWCRKPASQKRLAEIYDDLAVAHYDCGEHAVSRRYFSKTFRVAKSKRTFFRWIASWLPPNLVARFRRTS